MPRRKNPIDAVLTFFRTQPEEVCQMTLHVIKSEMQMRFTGLTLPSTRPRPTRRTRQIRLPFEASPDKQGG